MKSKKWDLPATDYNSTVLSVYDHDTNRKIESLITEYGGEGKRAVDLGCGTGNFLPLLTLNFSETVACDYSKPMIRTAKRNHRKLNKVSFETLS